MRARGFAGKVAVVTGAGSGIGRALAMELAHAGARVAISDVNADGLAETQRQLTAVGAEVLSDSLDVADRDAFLDYADRVAEHFGSVNQIYNNAGIAFFGDVEITRFDEFERVMNIDFWGVVNGTKAFLPHLIASGDGHVVNVSSAFGLFALPGQAAYNSAKFAVRGFTEALRQEMVLAKRPVKVTAVYPGGTKTSFIDSMGVAEHLGEVDLVSRYDKRAWTTSPERAAQVILRAVRRDQPRILIGPDTKILDLLVRLTGSAYQRVVPPMAARFVPPPAY